MRALFASLRIYTSEIGSSVTYNLVDEPWLPVQKNGGQALVSLREALVAAQTFGDLLLPRATLVPAVLRQVLLPVVIHACDIPRNPAEWERRWHDGRFPADVIDSYLDEHRARFDLFHSVQPFAQVGDLRTTKGETKPSSLLIPSIANGNNVPLFSARTEDDAPALRPAEALWWLLHTHCWDTAAIKTGAVGDPRAKGGKTTGNPTGPLGQLGVVVPLGRSLFETLMLNTPIRADGLPRGDRPQWCGEPQEPSWAERGPLGLLDLFTWQARRVRLFPSDSPDGVVVREVIVAAGDRLIADPDLEPHTAWALNPKPKSGEPPRRPRRLRAGRSAWQGLDSLLALDPPEDGTVETSDLLRRAADLIDVLGENYPLNVLTTGVIYGSQWAVVDHVVVDNIPLPVIALRRDADVRETLVTVVAQVDQLTRAINDLAADLRRAAGGDPVPWDRGQRPELELIHQLDPYVRRLLAGLQREPHREAEGIDAWQRTAYRTVRGLADRLLDALPPSAFAGRRDERDRVHRPANAERVFLLRVASALPRPEGTGPEGSLEEAS